MNKCVLLILTASLAFGSACKQAIEKTETASVSANITEKQEATMADDSKGKEFLELTTLKGKSFLKHSMTEWIKSMAMISTWTRYMPT